MDADNGYDAPSGEEDGIIQVTVRITDKDGKPLGEAEYAKSGISFGTTVTGSGAEVDSALDGAEGVLRIYGTLEEVQAYLTGLQVRFANAQDSNLDGNYKLEVIVDDRLYARSADTGAWSLRTGADGKPLANGGAQNQDGTNTPKEISAGAFDVYGDNAASINIFNIASATRDLFISSLNDPAEIGVGGKYDADKRTLADVETAGENTVTLDGVTIRDSDAQPDDILDVTITVPKGFSFVDHANGTLSDDGKTITLSGTLAQLNGWMSSVTINLPDVDGAGDTQRHDWNGSFDFVVTVNDRGNTGITPSSDPAPKDGNEFTIGNFEGKPAIITERTLTFNVTPTNDAPVVTLPDGKTGAKEVLPPVDEDFTHSGAPTDDTKKVDDLFGKYFDDSRDEIDNPSREDVAAVGGTTADQFWGVAVVGNAATPEQGEWQYWNGSQWLAIPTTAGDGSALLLNKDTAIQFVPTANWNGTPGDLTVRLVETNANNDTTSTTTPLTSGSSVNIVSGGGVGDTSLYSADTVALSTQVNRINDAPAKKEDFEDPGITVGEDVKEPEGKTVEELFKDAFDDSVDNVADGSHSDSFAGVAIVGLDSSNGTWQYNDGSGWVDLPADIGEAKAFILEASDQLRFVPGSDYNGTPDASVTVRLMDDSQGEAVTGHRADLSDGKAGGTTRYGDDSIVLSVTVTPENDAPTLTLDGEADGIIVEATETANETGGDAFEVPLLEGQVIVGDIDLSTTGHLSSDILGAGFITVKLDGVIHGDELRVTEGMPGMNGIPAYDAATGTLTIQLGEGATISQVQNILSAIKYAHTTDDPTNLNGADGPRGSLTFTVTLSDGNNQQSGGDAGGPEPLTALLTGTINLVAANDPPEATDDDNTLTNQQKEVAGNLIKGGGTDGNGDSVVGTPDSDPDTPTDDLRIVNIEVKTSEHGNDSPSVEVEDDRVTIQGKYGALTVYPDGRYTYELDANNPIVYGLAENRDLLETFEYTLSDGDGGNDTAQLTITINGTKPAEPSVSNAENEVHESGLRSPTDSNTAETVTGEIEISTPAGLTAVTVINRDGEEVVISLAELVNARNSPIEIDTHDGKLTITGFTAGLGSAIAPLAGTVEYSYTLRDAVDKSGPSQDVIELTAHDQVGAKVSGTLTITIIDDKPDAVGDTDEVRRSSPVTSGNVFSNDTIGADGPPSPNSPVTGVIKGLPEVAGLPVTGGIGGSGIPGEYGTLVLQPDGSYTYTLDLENPEIKALTGGETRTETFTYAITDADGDTTTATLTITIVGNTDPVANPDERTTPEDTPVSGNVITGGHPGERADSDEDASDTLKLTEFAVNGQTISVEPGKPGTTTIPGMGTITFDENGNYTFTPVSDWHGEVPPITYTVDDGNGGTATSTLTITVTPVTDAVNDRVSTEAATPVTIDPLQNDSFEGQDPIVSVEQGDGPSNGTVTVHPDGRITYTPDPTFFGTDTFTYTVISGGRTETATVTVVVAPENPVHVPSTMPPPSMPSLYESPSTTRSLVSGDQVGDPSVFFEGTVPNTMPRMQLPFHPIVYVNREVQAAQAERARLDTSSISNTYWSEPGVVGSVSIGSGLGQDPNLFVEHSVREAQRQGGFLNSVVLGRLGRTTLGADGELPTPHLHEPVIRVPGAPDDSGAPQEAQQDSPATGQSATAAQSPNGQPEPVIDPTPEPSAGQGSNEDPDPLAQMEAVPMRVSHAAPSFSEQLRGGAARLPVVLQAPKDLS